MDTVELQANDEAETDRIGRLLADVLHSGDVVTLIGELGAGKTRLVRSIVAALDGDASMVNSPTFVIVQHYQARLPVTHIDAYRLADADEFLALGGEELIGGEALCLIEWADRIADVLPGDCVRIEITATSPQSRHMSVSASGARSDALIAQLRERR